MRVVPIYVSDIERAKRRPVKEAVLRAIAEAYELPYAEVEELALTSRDEVQLRTAGQDDARKQVAVKLARAWTDMPDEKIEDLRRILDS
jgi:hypothetical protein